MTRRGLWRSAVPAAPVTVPGVLAALVAFVALVLVGLAQPPTAAAQAATTVTSAQVTTVDPRSITFEIQVSGAPVTEAVLIHQRANPSGALGGQIRAEVPSRGTGVIQADLVTNGSDVYIPVGTQFTYHWELRGEGGAVVETEPETFVFLDAQFQWQFMEDRGLRLYYYADADVAQRVLNASADAVEEVEALLQTDVPFPIFMLLWEGDADGTLAQRSRGGVYSDQSITGGARVAPDIVHVYSSLGLTFEDIARHEVTHVVVEHAGSGPFAQVPSWLDEGIATYAQWDKGSREASTEFAIRTDATLRLRNMVAPTNRAELIDLFYGQSWYVVEYLIDTYGEDDFAALIASIREGNPIDEALEATYGVDQDGLYNDWRESVGLPRLELTSTSSEVARPDATRAPLSIPTSVASSGGASTPSASEGGSGGSDGAAVDTPAATDSSGNTTTAIIIGVVAVLLAGALGGLGLKLLRSSK